MPTGENVDKSNFFNRNSLNYNLKELPDRANFPYLICLTLQPHFYQENASGLYASQL